MAAGMPGTGIGGLFYALLALLMPIKQLFARTRRTAPEVRWRAVGVQLGLLVGILAAMAATAWGITALVDVLRPDPVAADRALGALGRTLTRATLLAGAVSLAAVVALVQLLRLIVRRHPAPTRAPDDGARRESHR